MSRHQNYDEEIISLLINSINQIQIKKICIRLLSNDETSLRINDEIIIRNCRKFDEKISNSQTNDIASNDVSF